MTPLQIAFMYLASLSGSVAGALTLDGSDALTLDGSDALTLE